MKKMSSYRAFPTDFITFPLKGSIYGISTIWNGNNVEGHPVQVSYFITEAQIFIFLNFIHLFIYFWLCWVFTAVQAFLWLQRAGASLPCGALAYHGRGFSCGAQALGGTRFSSCGTRA